MKSRLFPMIKASVLASGLIISALADAATVTYSIINRSAAASLREVYSVGSKDCQSSVIGNADANEFNENINLSTAGSSCSTLVGSASAQITSSELTSSGFSYVASTASSADTGSQFDGASARAGLNELRFSVDSDVTMSYSLLYDEFEFNGATANGVAQLFRYLPGTGIIGDQLLDVDFSILNVSQNGSVSLLAGATYQLKTYTSSGAQLQPLDVSARNASSILSFSSSFSPVPVPAAVWLFGSGMIGLIGVAKRKVRT